MSPAAVENIEARPSAEGKKSDARSWFMTAIKFAISASLIAYLLSGANLGEIWAALNSANMTLIFLSFLLHGVGYFASSYRWKLLLQAQNYEFSVGYLMRSYAVAMFFNNLLPSTIGGDGYRAYDTARQGIPKGKAFAIVIVERFLGMFALMMFAILAFVMATGFIAQMKNLWLWSTLIFAGMILVVWGLFFRRRKITFLDKLMQIKGLHIIGKFLTKVAEAFGPFKGQTKVLGWTMLISLLFQLNVIFHYFLISEALDLHIAFSYFLVIIPVSILIQTLPISINGIGVREGIYVSFLTEMLGSATVEQSLAFSWIGYGMILLLGVLGGIIYIFRK